MSIVFLEQIDTQIVEKILENRTPWMTEVLSLLTYLANWQFIALLGTGMTFFLLIKRKKKVAMYIAGSLIVGGLAIEVLKHFVKRARPDAASAVISQFGYSFPSGHALISVVAYGWIAYLICKKTQNIYLKIFIITVATFLIVIIGFSRVYLGVHWPSDVLAGWAIGTVILVVAVSKRSGGTYVRS